MPAKGQSSSCRKGKEVVSDPPIARDVGEKAVYSELDHYDKEEVQRAPDSECGPLIDPWYNIYANFPKVPSDYTPPLPGCVWLALCRSNTDVSWAPLASSIPDLVIRQGTSLPVPIHFKFGSGIALGWKEWVDRELFDMGFMGLLQQAGVLKAIVSSCCLSNYRGLFNLYHLVRWWCTTTHTFFFSCRLYNTSFVHSTTLQHLLYECCAKHLAKRRPIRFAKKYLSCPRVITDFCGKFEFDFPLAFRSVGLKPIDHLAVEFFDKGVGFSWRAYRKLGTSYTCPNSVMGPFVDTTETTTSMTGFEERGITYLAATNTEWLPYLADESIRFVHYPANMVRRPFRLDQDIPDDLSSLMESPTSIRPFLRHAAFEF
ncbi:hypothetical protein SO802_018646 [Lithocarpus litseifolius]|uniref:Aminotransferase-like plant mobile domain-containing protein n=1 Tax=Lithocarpus litseifolius TaxID=425828 RepID=A0AAW2CML0_9ROSI